MLILQDNFTSSQTCILSSCIPQSKTVMQSLTVAMLLSYVAVKM